MNQNLENALRTILDFTRDESIRRHPELADAVEIVETYLQTFND